ncbi:hypothetical protein Ndes2526B_g04068 [Nannochloris sp. 'desiccata']|nr:hypothetical protein NADE_009307 [Chlorella desiccata (nom. nud.)]
MANVRDVVQTVIDGLDVFKGIFPDGNWQQVAANLAAPGQQQILQQQQQMQQQLTQQQQQLTQQQKQMQQDLQPIAQMQVTLQQMQQDFTSMRWNQANIAIRYHNKKSRDAIRPLHKEREGGCSSPASVRLVADPAASAAAVASTPLPPAHMHFPQNLSEAAALTVNELNQLHDFYQVQFAGLPRRRP